MCYIEREYDRYLESLEQRNECSECLRECDGDFCSRDCERAYLR